MDNIEKARKEKNITVTELTNIIGVSRDTYYKWIRKERNPKFQYLVAMCKLLEIDIKDIVENIF